MRKIKPYGSYISEINSGDFSAWKRHFEFKMSELPSENQGFEQEWYSEAAYKLAGSGKKGLEYLLRQVNDKDDLRLRAILSALSWPKLKSKHYYRLLKHYILDHRPLIAAEAIDSARLLGYQEFIPAMFDLRNHHSPYVVGSVLRFLSQHRPKLAVPLLIDALSSNDPIVVQNGIDELDTLGEVQALPKIQELQYHPNIHVQEAARFAARNLQKKLWGV